MWFGLVRRQENFKWEILILDISYPSPRTTQVLPGLQSYPKNFKRPFFWRFFEFLQLGNSNRSKNDPKIFFWKYLKNDRRYGHSKFWHSRWRCWFAGWDMTKIFFVNLAQSYDEHLLKISMRYLKQFLNNHQFTEKFWMPSA